MTRALLGPGKSYVPGAAPLATHKVLDGQIDTCLETKLNALGKRGWEVCGFESHRTVGVLMRCIILKRPALIAALPDRPPDLRQRRAGVRGFIRAAPPCARRPGVRG